MGQTYHKPPPPRPPPIVPKYDLPPAPQKYSDGFWRDVVGFDKKEMEALEQLRKLGVEIFNSNKEPESPMSNDEKESRIREFCNKYYLQSLPLDIDKYGELQYISIAEDGSRDVWHQTMLDRCGETLMVFIGMVDLDCLGVYLAGSGKLYREIRRHDDSIFLYYCKDIGKSSAEIYHDDGYTRTHY